MSKFGAAGLGILELGVDNKVPKGGKKIKKKKSGVIKQRKMKYKDILKELDKS